MRNVLRLAAHRVLSSDSGSVSRAGHRFLDFLVDGERLADRIGPMAAGLVPVLVLDWPGGFPAENFGWLLGEVAPALPDHRVPLYLCAECGDLGCGGLTAAVVRSDETVVWRELGHQNDYEPFDRADALTHVGPFEFDRADYEAVLQQFPEEWKGLYGPHTRSC